MMSRPSISVVIPLFNKERYVSAAIDSVLSQSFQDFEIVVVNDGSTDDGPRVVEQRHDLRIRLIHQNNGGVSAARNRGIREASSDVIAFLDADDEWMPGFLSTIMELRTRYPKAGAYATAYRISKGNGIYRDVIASGFSRAGRAGLIGDYFGSAHRAPVSASSVAVPRRLFDRVGGFREGCAMGEDMDMWFRIAAYYDVAYCPTISAVWRFTVQDSACQTRLPEEKSPITESMRQIEASLDVPAEVKGRARLFWTRHVMRDARSFCRSGRKDVARRLLLQADCRTAPFNAVYTILFVILPAPILAHFTRQWVWLARMVLRSRHFIVRGGNGGMQQ
jgi:glycosyltransferase involved in cell wall biosynthesis